MENRVFDSGEDLNRIDVITSEDISTHSENISSVGSRNKLTEKYANDHQESIELSSNENQRRRHSSLLNGTNLSNSRVPTPVNMVRRWSQSISRFSKDKQSFRGSIYRFPSRNLFQTDDSNSSSADPDAELEILVQEIEQYELLMQDTAQSKHNRLETLRILPQPLSVKRSLKAQLSITMEQQHLNKSERSSKDFSDCVFNILFMMCVNLWKFLRIVCKRIEIWYRDLKTIEGHFGSNVSSYFKFLRWLLAFDIILFIFPLGFITIPQILYYDDVRWRTPKENVTGTVDLRQYGISNSTDKVNNQTWSVLDFLTGEGLLKSSLIFYGSYSNATLNYRNSKRTYSIPKAYYMTMLILYLTTFVVISISVARSHRKSFIEILFGIRSQYGMKIFFAWDYGIADYKAAALKHYSIHTELKEVLRELGGSKLKPSIWYHIWICFVQSVAHLLICGLTATAGFLVWILLKECGDTSNASSPWSKLYVATFINVTILLLQTIFSWVSNLEHYRSPCRTLHICLVRSFLLESTVVGVLIYYWITRKHAEGWETAIGQEIYRLIISDCFISMFVLPIINCSRVFIIMRYFPQYERPEFDISLKSLGLVFNQTLLWMGLFFAPLLAGVMILKIFLLFYLNKAMLMYICKSPKHVWRLAQSHTLYLLFSFLSLLGVILTLGYIMTQIPVSQQTGPFRDQSYMFQMFIDGVLRLRQNHTIWTILMFLIRPAVVGIMLIFMSVMVYYLRAKSRARCMMVKVLKDMIKLEVKDKQFLLTTITKLRRNHQWPLKSSSVNENPADSTGDRHTARSPTWQHTRRRLGGNAKPLSNIISSVDECIKRNRDV